MSRRRAWLPATAAAACLFTLHIASAETAPDTVASQTGSASSAAAASVEATAPLVVSQDVSSTASAMRGLWLTTPFPERAAEFGDTIALDIVLQNKALPPERVELSVDGLPQGWKSEIDGKGARVTAAIVASDEDANLRLVLTPPKDAEAGTFAFHVKGEVQNADPGTPRVLDLPVKLTLAAPKPAKLTFDPKLPSLRGTGKSSFDFELSLKNDSLKDTVVNLAAQAPQGFQISFTEGYGSQQITSLPVKAGVTKTIKAKVKAPQGITAGTYNVSVAAQSETATVEAPLHLDITGQPQIAVRGPRGLLSGTATAGEEHDFTFTVANSGTDAANAVTLRASAPSGWKTEVEPKTIDVLAPGANQQVTVKFTPSKNAVAGDYMTNIRASGNGVSNTANFRVTVETSTLWGITGLGVIAASLLIMAVGVRRYGRR